MALQSAQFANLVGIGSDLLGPRSGVAEFTKVLQLLNSRRAQGRPPELITPQFVIEQRELLRLSEGSRPFPLSIRALSPSDPTIELALQEISNLIPKEGELPRAITAQSPNHTSIALWIEAGVGRVLLGADLEHHDTPGRGWLAVLNAHHDETPATIFKVPHHGSRTADYAEVWRRMVISEVIAIVTPFNGGRRLPTEGDLTRIAGRTPRGYCTAIHSAAAPRRDPLVERKIKEVVKQRRVTVGQPGHVRVRWKVGEPKGSLTVDVFNGAYQFSPGRAA